MSEPGSLSNLLKYRFSKRSVEKLNHSGDSMSNNTSNGVNTNGGGTSSSPVFNKTYRPLTDSGDIGWLSKTTGSAGAKEDTENSKSQTTKYKRLRTYTASDDSDSEDDCGSTDTPTFSTGQSSPSESQSLSKSLQIAGEVQWEQQLHSMFPNASPMQIRAAVAAASRTANLEAGIDYLIKGHSAVKRSHDCQDEQNGTKSYKRIRMMSGDSSDSQTTLPPPQSLADSQTTESYSMPDSQSTVVYHLSESEKTSIEFLQGAFPNLPLERLRQVLSDCHGNTDQAVAVLSSDVKDAEEENQQVDKGSGPEKTRGGMRSSNNVKLESLSMSDEEADYEEDEDGEDSDDSVDADRNSGKQEMILSFFEEATMPELTVLPGCSRKKAEVLAALRPFGSWDRLVEMLTSSKQLSYSLITGCYEIIQLRNVVVRLMRQCEQISGHMELVVAQLTGRLEGPSDEEDQVTIQPALLNSQNELKPYQLIGLNWLRLMHSQQLNGILADEMGLGKTIQAISFLAHLLEQGDRGPHVIIVPSSTIENWLRELSSWCPALGVIVYYGSQEERRATRHSIMYEGRDDFHVLLTTYNMATGSVEDRSLFKKFQFHYAVFDEGHMLKNMSSLRFQNLMKICADRRLLLTGTPLQNNLIELMSLLCFVMPDIFQGKTEPLKKMFSMISRSDGEQGKYEKERIAQAQRIMRPFVLRRLKKDVLTQLPKKEEEIKFCPLLPAQQELYDSLLQKFSKDLAEQEYALGTKSAGMAMFMQLRKAANHPLLVRNHYDDTRLLQMATALAKEPSHRQRGALPKLIMEDMAQMNDFDLIALCRQYKKHLGKFQLDPKWIGQSAKFCLLDSLLEKMKGQDDRVLLFSQFTMMLDIVEEFLKEKSIKYLRLDGSTPVTDRQQLIDKFNEDPHIFIFLLSTRAGGLGINLTAANTIIIHDIDFNPYNDKQAEDRCHRLGQKRPVKILRLIAQGTVEEGMLACARAKLRLEQDVTSINEDAEEAQVDVAMLLREAIGRAKKLSKETAFNSETSNPQLSSSSS